MSRRKLINIWETLVSYLSENILFIQWKGVLEANSWREERRPSPREYLLRPIHFTQFKSFPFLPRFPFLFSPPPTLFLNVLRSTARRILLAAPAKFFFHMLRGQNLCDRDPRAIGERPLGGQEWIERLAPGYFTNMWPENTSRTCVPFPLRSLSFSFSFLLDSISSHFRLPVVLVPSLVWILFTSSLVVEFHGRCS